MTRALLFLCFVLISLTAHTQDVSLDKKLGAENALMVEQEMGIYYHDSLYNLVNAVGKKLVSRLKSNPFDFKFFLVDSPQPNAFALPGGYIYVTRGILPIIETEDELAGIMAHEIIHVMQRHSVKQMKKGMVTGLLKIPGNLVNSVTGTRLGNILNAPISLTTSVFIAKYSRGHETEADKFGIQLAASAGYKTDALADALERLSKEIELLTGDAEQHSYFSDHPFTPSRITSIRSSASMFKPVNPSPINPSKESFLKNFNGLCYGLNPEQGIFMDSLFVQPDFGFSWITPGGWETIYKPSMVAAYSLKGDAIVALHIADKNGSVHEMGEEAKSKSQKISGVTIASAGDTIINSFPAYILRMKSVEEDQVMISELIWLTYQDVVLQLVGVCTPALKKEIHYSLCSFRKAKQEELQQINLYELQLVRARANETIEKLTDRMGNRLSPAMTAVINSPANNTSFYEGELVKIVKVSPYQPKR
jgi:predicted Zn-dependent protease